MAQTGQDFSLFLQSREKVGFQKRNHTFITYMQRMRGVREKGLPGPLILPLTQGPRLLRYKNKEMPGGLK